MKTHSLKAHLIPKNDRIDIFIKSIFFGTVFCVICAASHGQDLNWLMSAKYKLSTGIYSIKDANGMSQMALDTNLRASSDLGNTWLGYYESEDKTLRQTRMGWDSVYHLGPIRVLPSLQSASGGFLGGSLGVETGERFFVGAGIGRTNLNNYVNLNFDPNDSWSLSGGYHWADERVLSVQIVHDNRLNPDQQHVHISYRQNFSENDRFLIDLLYKSGTVDTQAIKAYGILLGMDVGVWGLRFAYDPKVNFTSSDMRRLIVSYRF